ncbi:asparagine synthase (glutamine-hydrolyzing) [Fortiea sp. LEGE XX443]|uniref:asparagine synthase (glutamine-hydrolyzing) n=1 Tax=Fortiea sp. LEGE XX443 TaxID=1828611 RepID=UPI00187E5AA3|nr:asparagine synthase (glutamine-hydrolyzing) [Fortiea sp. LEGE XX443]MBE9008238.1 asparagine synthase (glutamine-hydrolyzing) [Fortiea sp. LEGE XX443]
MCGIAGILTQSEINSNLETLVQKMQTAIKHRGPDDLGTYISSDRQVALAHTRLAILDLSSDGHQPMSTANGRYWITFNGEIYNFSQLRSDLISQGEVFQSHTDTEVILKLYQRMGADCVERLRGMFAFAIWDDWEKTCFIARDPLGIKPLYYWQSGSTLAFASELRAILASGLPTINLSPEGLYGYLVSGSVPEPYTLIADIHCLEAGYWLYWQSDRVTKKQYWQIEFLPETILPTEAIKKVRTALEDSIQHHFVSDVPVGIFLSGGIDSTTVLALASKTQNEQLSTYSIAFEETKWNEGDIAQKVAKLFGTKHTEYKVTASIAQQLFPKFLQAVDQPSVDGFNTFCVSQIAHENGTKVVLSGLGGDEIFGGYQSFQKIPQMVALGQQLQTLPFVKNNIGKGLSHWGKSPKIKRLGDFLEQPPTSVSAYHSLRGIFSHREACAIIQQYLPQQTPNNYRFPVFHNKTAVSTIADEVSLLELSGYMRNQLLRDSDVMSMNWGLELRVPLVDRNLFETVAKIPSSIRLAAGKKLLIQSVPELPEWVFNRPKKGFYFPFQQWLSRDFQDYFSNVKVPQNIPLNHWYRRWSLVMLQQWLECIYDK